jgi:hypothetical protein
MSGRVGGVRSAVGEGAGVSVMVGELVAAGSFSRVAVGVEAGWTSIEALQADRIAVSKHKVRVRSGCITLSMSGLYQNGLAGGSQFRRRLSF